MLFDILECHALIIGEREIAIGFVLSPAFVLLEAVQVRRKVQSKPLIGSKLCS